MPDDKPPESIGLIRLTPEIAKAFGESIDRAEDDVAAIVKGPAPTVEQVAWVFHKIDEHLREGGTFRYLIYERMGFGPDAYLSLFLTGGQNISNALTDARDGPWEDVYYGLPDVFDALIEIGASFGPEWHDPEGDPVFGPVRCNLCSRSPAMGCHEGCPGLRARRALGVA